jgi:hypothetical protein
MQGRTREVVAGFFWSKFVRTLLYMSSPMSVHNHWPFDHYFQSLCVLVLYALRHHIKIRVVIVPHEHVCMIDGLVLTAHLENELT